MKTEVEIDVKTQDKTENVCKHEKPTKLEIICGLLSGILFLIAIIAYLLIGFLTNIWHPTWIMFFAPIVISSLVMAIGKKKAKKFNYPFFIVMIYVLFSSLFNLWHPLWVLFITIPLYYSFLKLIKELKNK